METRGLPHFTGYFTVEVPQNLKDLLGGEVLRLRNVVTEYNKYLKLYGETASIVEDKFHNNDDEFLDEGW